MGYLPTHCTSRGSRHGRLERCTEMIRPSPGAGHPPPPPRVGASSSGCVNLATCSTLPRT
eukprot:14177538-Heterocapsa_arctica.AAC.1